MAELHREADVVIAGGGVAGFCAGIAAARNGASTLVIERYGFLGGMFTGGNMTVLNSPPVGGIGKEIVDRLTAQGYAKRVVDDPPNYPIFHYASEYSIMNIAYDAEMAKTLLFDMAEEAGLRLLLHSWVTGVEMEQDRVTGLEVQNKSGRQVVSGKVIVDASSDGDVAALAGVPFTKGQTEEGILFAMTMLVRLSNINWPAVSEYSRKDPGLKEAIAGAQTVGELPYYRPRTREMANYWGHARPELSHLVYPDEALLWGGTVEGVDGTNVDDLSRAEIEVRKQFMSELSFLRKHVPGFEQAKIESTGATIGVRDTRHVVGEYTLTGVDILERRRFNDVAGYNLKGGYPVNDLPYRCFVPKRAQGLLVAGNCMSVVPGSTQRGPQLGSYNNLKDIPTMWTTGEAAGTAAALCAMLGTEPRELDVTLIQERLRLQGALIADSEIERLKQAKLPSGKTVEQFYSEQVADMKQYWGSRGQLE